MPTSKPPPLTTFRSWSWDGSTWHVRISGDPPRRLVLEAEAEAFTRFSQLNLLSARHCNFGDEDLGALFAGPPPYALILEDTEVTPDGLEAASQPGLGELVYSENRVTYPGATSFGNWPGLKRLTMDRVGLIDDQLTPVVAMQQLKILELPRNDIFRRPRRRPLRSSPISPGSISQGPASTM